MKNQDKKHLKKKIKHPEEEITSKGAIWKTLNKEIIEFPSSFRPPTKQIQKRTTIDQLDMIKNEKLIRTFKVLIFRYMIYINIAIFFGMGKLIFMNSQIGLKVDSDQLKDKDNNKAYQRKYHSLVLENE